MPERLLLTLIRRDGGTQSREGVNFSVIDEYAQAMREGAEFPPIDVFFDGTDCWLADGFHRLAAAEKVADGHPGATIPATVHQGTKRDAVLFSVGANASHGLRRTNADKRNAVRLLLSDPEWAKFSDREIARRCGVSDPFVGQLRSELATANVLQSRIGADGRVYNVANIGKRPEAQAAPVAIVDPSPQTPPFTEEPPLSDFLDERFSYPVDHEARIIYTGPVTQPGVTRVPGLQLLNDADRLKAKGYAVVVVDRPAPPVPTARANIDRENEKAILDRRIVTAMNRVAAALNELKDLYREDSRAVERLAWGQIVHIVERWVSADRGK